MSEGYQVKVRPEKAEEVGRIRAELDEASAAVVTEYRGLTVEALKVLRSRLLEHDTTYRVTKNTLARRAAAELGLEALEEMLVGPVAVAYVKGDPIAASKIIATFAREHPELADQGRRAGRRRPRRGSDEGPRDDRLSRGLAREDHGSAHRAAAAN